MDTIANTYSFRNHRKLYLLSFFLGTLVSLCAFFPFLWRNGGLLYLSDDYIAQEMVFGRFANDAIKSGNTLFNWGIDIGSDFVPAFSFYNLGSPFFWLTLLFPADQSPYLMGCIFPPKYGVAACTACIWLRQYTDKDWSALLGSLLYAFSGFQSVNVVFYHFHDAVAFFPLLLVGLDHLMRTRKISLFTFCVALNALVNWNFFVGEVIWLILYYVIRYDFAGAIRRREKEKLAWHGPMILRSFVGGIVGGMMAAVLFLPSVYAMLGIPRADEHIPSRDWLVFGTEGYLQMLKGVLFPGEPMNFQFTMANMNWYSVAVWLPMVGILPSVAFFLSKERELWLRRLLAICGVISLVPVLNNMFTLFSAEPYRRWYYMPILMMALASVLVLERTENNKPMKRVLWTAAKICMAAALFYTIYMLLPCYNVDHTSAVREYRKFFAHIVFGVAGWGFTLFCLLKLEGQKRASLLMLAGVMGFSWLTTALNIHFYRVPSPWHSGKEVKAEMFDTAEGLPADVLPYRYSFFVSYFNRQMAHSLPSNDSFISTIDGGIFNFYEALGSNRHTLTLDGPRGTDQLLSVRWYVKDGPWDAGPGTPKVRSNGFRDIYLYEDPNALPIGFAYTEYITRSELERIPKRDRAVAMLHYLVVNDEDAGEVGKSLQHFSVDPVPKFDGESLPTAVKNRGQECSRDFKADTRGFSCSITTGGERYVFFSVPYSLLWSAEVNGSEADIKEICGLMAVKVPEGESSIVFSYSDRIRKAGIGLSVIGILLWAAVLVFESRKADLYRSGT